MIEPLASDGRDGQDLCTFETGSGQNRCNLRRRSREPVRAHQVALVQRDNAALQAQQIHDRQVLARLRHHAVIGGDDQHDEVDTGGTGQHVVHQALVARHIDEADDLAARPRPIRKSQVDRDAARLLLLQAIGIDARQLVHQ
jgi:hypothetical protein